jgi:hypothetical protein
VQALERGAPSRLILERAFSVNGPFAPVADSPQLFLGNKTFRFTDTPGAATAFYRVRAEL